MSVYTARQTQEDRLARLISVISDLPSYWGNIEFTSLTIKTEDGWLEQDGGMKGFTLIGVVHRIELTRRGERVNWIIDVREGRYVARDFLVHFHSLYSTLARLCRLPSIRFLCNYLSERPHYWKNVDFSSLTLAHENAWLEKNGKMECISLVGRVVAAALKGREFSDWALEVEQPDLVACDFDDSLESLEKSCFSLVGRVIRVKLGDSTSRCWSIELEQPASIASDFDRTLLAFEGALRRRLGNPKLWFKASHGQLRLERWQKDYPLHTQFPHVYDGTSSIITRINDKKALDPSRIHPGSIVVCTAYARAFTRSPLTSVKFALDSVRLLGPEYEVARNVVPVPSTPSDI
ncbi:hypothetical protein P7C70_g6806, partial [Phenoliferia sp. Uapishka_3]